MRRASLATCLCLLFVVPPARAAVFHDAASNAQRMIEFIWMQTAEVRKMAEMIRTTMQLVEQVKGTYQMIEYALENLKNMPHDGNIFNWLTSMESQISGILGHVQWIGFNLDRTTRDFEKLYGNVAALTTPQGRAERYRQMREARLEMTGIAMQTQSIRQTFTGIYERLTILLGISSIASGQKALQQLQMQQQALAQKQQQIGLSMQAVQARLVAMEQAEKIVRDMMEEEAAAHLAQVWYGGTGKALLPAGFNGFMIMPVVGGQ
jgi:prefoldin subunit 5